MPFNPNMKLNLDLGQEMSEACCPVNKTEDTKKYYPSFHYSGDKPLRVPKEGEMVVRYKKVSSGHNETPGGKEHFDCTIEIREIISVGGEDYESPPASNRMKDSEDALDKLRREKIDEDY